MGTCSSRIYPGLEIDTLFEELEDNMRILHNMYNTIIRDKILNIGIFTECIHYDAQMTEKRHRIEQLILQKKEYIVHKYKVNEIKLEQLNALLTFKTNILQFLISKEFIIETSLLHNPQFKSFLSILPDSERRDSYNNYISIEKQKSDSSIYNNLVISNPSKNTHRHFINKYDRCSNCNSLLTQGSSLSIVKHIHTNENNTHGSTPKIKMRSMTTL
jgi:hypothetical protein